MRNFFVSQDQINDETNEIIIKDEDVNHIKNVLRLEKGEKIKICAKSSEQSVYAYICEINDISKDFIKCNIIEKEKNDIESTVQISIFQGLPKFDKMELIIQKCTELGAFDFTPVSFNRSIVKLTQKDELKKIERWQKIAEMASKQSGRFFVPKVNNLKNIDELCTLVHNYDLVLLAYENEQNNLIKDELLKIKNQKEKYKIAIIIGPEGGLEEEEVKKLFL